MSSIKLESVAFGYNTVNRILDGISVEIKTGEFLGIIGPNGSGKTTLMRVLTRAVKPLSGMVMLDGTDIWKIPAKEFARRVSVVPQDIFVAFEFTVREVVLMGRSPHLSRFSFEKNQDYEAAEEAMRLTGIEHLADRCIHALSGGEMQRAIIARALAQKTEIIFLDEPTSHLDLRYQFEIMDLLRRLNREHGLTIGIVMHDLNLAAQFCGRLILMDNGRKLAEGSPEDVITEERIRAAYGVEVWVRRHPVTGRPYVISSVKSALKHNGNDFENKPSIHVICGGGTGASVFARLMSQGFKVTAGTLTAGDADQEVAESLGIDTVCLPPFQPIDDEATKKNLKLAKESAVVVVTDFPVGGANMANLKAAVELLECGLPVVLLHPQSIALRDFTGGAAIEKMEHLLQKGAIPAESLSDLVKKAREIVSAKME